MKVNICNKSRTVREAAAAAVVVCACLAQGCGAPSRITVTGMNTSQSEAAAVLLSDVEEPDYGASARTPEADIKNSGLPGSVRMPEDGASVRGGVPGDGITGSASGGGGEDMSAVAVYVCGAVIDPGVYYLKAGDRICDAIEAAGGFTEDADREWLNQARLISDGEMLVVCTEDETSILRAQGITQAAASAGDTASPGGFAQQADSLGGGLVNLNTATKEQLMTLPGIGEAKADSIIRYRTENGFFASTEDVMNISGIKNSIYEKIRDRITV